jgi:amino-acid N-acetyltransferase
MEIRKALTKDAVQIHALVNRYAKQEQMLPRTLLSIYENIRDFYVAVDGDRVLGCSAAFHLGRYGGSPLARRR